jgi:hypothetical protein
VTRWPVITASGTATWLSCIDAEVNTALIGICPSATSRCSLEPTQNRFLSPGYLFLQPALQDCGNSASIWASVILPEH